jgi:DNA-binding LacI/PurR family transcriptional regulator
MASSVTIRDVARRAGVSTATVSYVLNDSRQVGEETRRRVMTAARELGYRPSVIARGLQAGESRMLGYSWRPVSPNQFNPILEQFINSVAEASARHGYHVLTFPYPDESSAVDVYRELVESGRVDGFILPNTRFDDERIRYLRKAGFPFVAFGRSNPDWDFPWVDVDGADGVRQAMEYLYQLGHRRIACLAWPEELVPGHYRLLGYQSFMDQAGLPMPEGFILRAENDYHAGYRAMHDWLALAEEQQPTAVVALSDLLAIGVLNAGCDAGLVVGSDLAVVGFDDSPIACYLRPPLTSLRQPIRELGDQLISMLIGLVQHEDVQTTRVLLKPRLIVRDSTGPCPTPRTRK